MLFVSRNVPKSSTNFLARAYNFCVQKCLFLNLQKWDLVKMIIVPKIGYFDE